MRRPTNYDPCCTDAVVQGLSEAPFHDRRGSLGRAPRIGTGSANARSTNRAAIRQGLTPRPQRRHTKTAGEEGVEAGARSPNSKAFARSPHAIVILAERDATPCRAGRTKPDPLPSIFALKPPRLLGRHHASLGPSTRPPPPRARQAEQLPHRRPPGGAHVQTRNPADGTKAMRPLIALAMPQSVHPCDPKAAAPFGGFAFCFSPPLPAAPDLPGHACGGLDVEV